ncbi:hypothetical protein GCM10023219_15040 [Stakelama sediminis]|uniref:DUF2975 domain-containing protein n=1 Tax=Stakelama sediminis TaxID=463200 RepID=A0A840YX56_9SPHN|nr:DUF2975 domain-containing protein [Stakelama sediminis]MBB5718233.1 hypothetical protein [Stakelama sediminis]
MKLNALTLSRLLVRILFWLNIVLAAAFVALLLWWSVSPHWIESILGAKYGSGKANEIRELMQAALLLGILTAAPVGMILAMLLRMIETVRAGTPFVAINAQRLRLMGWLVLGLQVADLIFSALGIYAGSLHADWQGSTPSLMGWLLALLLFVLARIFSEGVAMRDDLEGTV